MGKGRLEAFSDGVFAIINSFLGLAMYLLVAAMWFIPDKRIEDKL